MKQLSQASCLTALVSANLLPLRAQRNTEVRRQSVDHKGKRRNAKVFSSRAERAISTPCTFFVLTDTRLREHGGKRGKLGISTFVVLRVLCGWLGLTLCSSASSVVEKRLKTLQ